MPYVNSLISIFLFVPRYIIPTAVIYEILRLVLVSVAQQAGLNLSWSQHHHPPPPPEERFSRDVAVITPSLQSPVVFKQSRAR